MCLQAYCRRLRIWETDFGREGGWVIEWQGRPLAVLTDPRSEEMFWDSYHAELITDDSELREALLTTEFWNSKGIVWRSREFGEVAPFAFPAIHPFCEPGRLMMRGLYLSIGWPWPWDWLVLWIRRWWSRIRA